MKLLKLFAFAIIIIVLGSSIDPKTSSPNNKVVVNIDFGGVKDGKIHYINWYQGITAMTAVQACATIETHAVKEKYIFISSIDTVKTEIGVKAWYYTVNGKSTNKLAYNYTLKSGDTLTWIYKKDVCSPKSK